MSSSHTHIDVQCQSLQLEEQEVLEAIFPECVSNEISKGFVKLEIPIEWSESREVSIFDDGTVASSHGNHPTDSNRTQDQLLSLSTLPPLLLHIILPPDYPLHNPPKVVSIRATHSWLPCLPILHDFLAEMWNAGDCVLYDWVEFIRSGEFLNSMELTSTTNTNDIIRIPHPAPWLLAPLLTAYESSTKSRQFSQNSYPCSICLTAYKGAKCLQLSCSHIFCRSCLEDFWKLCIAEGDIGRVGCPDPECIKAGREANEEEVVRVATEEEVLRWKWLREKRALEKDPTIIHCPMSFCQSPISKPVSEETEESGWDRLRTCGNCSYSFCSFCKRTWHGPISECPISVTEALVLEYKALPENSPGRQVIERRFGKNSIAKLVATFEEEQSNKKWLEASTMACPGCLVHVEKSLGCNHMTCAKCTQHFCYRCGTKLDASNPYKHFSTPGSCYSKLFDFQSDDDEWQPVGGFEMI